MQCACSSRSTRPTAMTQPVFDSLLACRRFSPHALWVSLIPGIQPTTTLLPARSARQLLFAHAPAAWTCSGVRTRGLLLTAEPPVLKDLMNKYASNVIVDACRSSSARGDPVHRKRAGHVGDRRPRQRPVLPPLKASRIRWRSWPTTRVVTSTESSSTVNSIAPWTPSKLAVIRRRCSVGRRYGEPPDGYYPAYQGALFAKQSLAASLPDTGNSPSLPAHRLSHRIGHRQTLEAIPISTTKTRLIRRQPTT